MDVPIAIAPDMVMAAKVDVPLDTTLPVKFPATLPVTLPVRFPVTLPTSVPVNPELALKVVNAPAAGVVPPIIVLFMTPPAIVTELPKEAAPLETINPANLPVEAVVAPTGVLSIELDVIASDCKAAEAVSAVPAELTIATL